MKKIQKDPFYNKTKGLIIFIFCFFLCYILANYLEVFSNGFSNSDEPSHFVNSFFVREFLTHGYFNSPIKAAEQFYISYPKLAIGHWPPLYYCFVGSLFLIFPATPQTAVWINIFITALCSSLLSILLLPRIGLFWALISTLLFIFLPITLEGLNFFLLDQPLTVIIFLAAWVWWRYSSRPTFTLAFLYGFLSALAILTKGNGWLLGIFPIIHIIYTGNYNILKHKSIYAGALLCMIPTIPWYLVTAKISADGFNYSFGLKYALIAFTQNSITLYKNFGLFGVIIGIFSAIKFFLKKENKNDLSSLASIATCMVISVLIFQSLIPVDLVSRYMLPAAPFLLILIVLGIIEMGHFPWLEYQAKRKYCVQLAAILLVFYSGASNILSVSPQADLRMSQAAEMSINSQSLQGIMIDGSPSEEGAFIAEALVASKAKNLYVVRSSKAFSESNFMGSKYKLTAQSQPEIKSILKELGISHIILSRRGSGKRAPHSVLLERFLSKSDSGYKILSTLEHRWRPGTTYIYVANHPIEANIAAIKKVNFPKKSKLFHDKRVFSSN